MGNFSKTTMEDLRNLPRVQLTEEQKKSDLADIFDRPQADVGQKKIDILNGGPGNAQLALPIEKRSDLFLPGYQSMEDGYCIMSDGTGFVANRTFFPDVTPEMFDWWFNFHPLDDIRLAMWLQNGHMTCRIPEPYVHTDESGISQATRNWGKEHFPVESFDGVEDCGEVCIRFFSPQEFGLDMHKVLVSPVKAFAAASCFWYKESLILFGEEDAKKFLAMDPDIRVGFNSFLHTARPVEGGCEVRSRFWIGKYFENGTVHNTRFPDGFDVSEVTWKMYRHTIQEFANLASFLPEVYNRYDGKITK